MMSEKSTGFGTVSQKYPTMTPLSIALALFLSSPPPPSPSPSNGGGGWMITGRLVDERELHLGVRPAVFYDGSEIDVGVTVQLSINVL